MKLKIDENVSRHVVGVCAAFGHEAHTVHDENLAGKPDSAVVGAATAEDRMLLTLDRGLGDVRFYPPGSHRGIVILRPNRTDAPGMIAFLREFLERYSLEDLDGCVVVVEPAQIRVRRPAR